MKSATRTSVRLSTEAHAHVADESARTLVLLGEPEPKAAAIDRIIREHARMTAWVNLDYTAHGNGIHSVDDLLEALEEDSIRLIETEEDEVNTAARHKLDSLERDYMKTSAALARRIVADNPAVETAVRFLDKYAEIQKLEAENQKLKAA